MPEVRIRPRAERDLEDIWRYTEQRWSRGQALEYVSAIRAAFTALAEDPRSGRSAEAVRTGYFRQSVQSHVVFFRRLDDGIEVVRVLHQSMDFEARLSDND